jgi:hypothetical protein
MTLRRINRALKGAIIGQSAALAKLLMFVFECG